MVFSNKNIKRIGRKSESREMRVSGSFGKDRHIQNPIYDLSA